MPDNERFNYLFARYAEKNYSPEEGEEFFRLIDGREYDELLERLVDQRWNLNLPEWVRENEDQKAEAMFQTILDRVRTRRLFPFKMVAAAAAILILLAGAGTWLFRSHPAPRSPILAAMSDIAPGGNKAILTLSNGQKIILDSAKNGIIAHQENTDIEKRINGELAYTPQRGGQNLVDYNILSTPRGGQYQLKLPDGTHVWLNAASSITYPTAFTSKTREVSITGEAYFDIAHDATRPFRVSASRMEVRVLGTEFNINAYTDEPEIRTTLVNGAVSITRGSLDNTLKPGEQAQLDNKNGLHILSDADVEAAVAWKAGTFHFDHLDLYSAMRQIARWYDVDVVYKGEVPDNALFGYLSRNTRLSTMMELLSKVNVHASLEGRRLTLTP